MFHAFSSCVVEENRGWKFFQAHSTHSTRLNIFCGMMLGKVINQVFLHLGKKCGHLGKDKVPLSQDCLCLAILFLHQHLVALFAFHWENSIERRFVLLVQDELSKIQLKCRATGSEKAECVIIRAAMSFWATRRWLVTSIHGIKIEKAMNKLKSFIKVF